MHRAWVGIRDFGGRLLGAKSVEASISGTDRNSIEIRIRGKLKMASLDEGIARGIYSITLEKGLTAPDLDLEFVGKCPSGRLAFKTHSQQIVRFGRDLSLVPVPKLDMPDNIQGKSHWKETKPGVFVKSKP
jgi:hypothetical protein